MTRQRQHPRTHMATSWLSLAATTPLPTLEAALGASQAPHTRRPRSTVQRVGWFCALCHRSRRVLAVALDATSMLGLCGPGTTVAALAAKTAPMASTRLVMLLGHQNVSTARMGGCPHLVPPTPRPQTAPSALLVNTPRTARLRTVWTVVLASMLQPRVLSGAKSAQVESSRTKMERMLARTARLERDLTPSRMHATHA